MKRADLIALTDELECLEREQVYAAARSTIHAMVQFARQIAESQPVAVRHNFDGHGWLYIDGGSGSDWLTRYGDAEALYTLPLED